MLERQVRGRLADGIDVGRAPGYATGVHQGGPAAVKQRGDMRVVAASGQRTVQLGLLLHRFGQTPLGALVEHADDRTDDFQVAEFLGGDVHQQVLATGIALAEALGEIAHGGGQLALRPAELLQQQVGQARIGRGDPDGVLQSLVMYEHGSFLCGFVDLPSDGHSNNGYSKRRFHPAHGSSESRSGRWFRTFPQRVSPGATAPLR